MPAVLVLVALLVLVEGLIWLLVHFWWAILALCLGWRLVWRLLEPGWTQWQGHRRHVWARRQIVRIERRTIRELERAGRSGSWRS